MKAKSTKSTPKLASVAETKRQIKSKADPGLDSRKALVAQFDLCSSPGHLLRRCHSRARAIFEEVIGRETGLSKQQVALMVTIAQNPSATHAQLSEESGFDRNTLADTLDRLIAKGLASRVRSSRDARAYEIGLTEAGESLLEELVPLSLQVQNKIIDPIPEALRPTFVQCLRLLAGVSNHKSVDDEILSLLDGLSKEDDAQPKTRGNKVVRSTAA